MKKVISIIIVLAFAITGIAAISATAAPAVSPSETVTYTPGHTAETVEVVLTSGPRSGD